jgi:tetratricopeptide (TPR) repeat protein
MDIQQFEEMIIDYLDGSLSGAEKKYFEEALNSSDEYRGIFEQYTSIRTVTGSENDLEPPAEVIERISEQVKKSIKKEKKSVFERWFKFPILAPVFAVAIIAMLWISAGEDYLKNKNIIPVAENSTSPELRSDYKVSAGKLNQKEAVIQEEIMPGTEVDKIESGRRNKAKPQAAFKKPSYSAVPKNDSRKIHASLKPAATGSMDDLARSPIEQESEIISKDTDKGIKSDDLVTEKSKDFADVSAVVQDSRQKDESNYESEKPASDKNEFKSDVAKSGENAPKSLPRTSTVKSTISPSKRVEITNGYRNELNEIVTMQYKGDCQESLERSQKLLDADPEPSISIKTDLYLTQGECFMELKEYDKALEVYEKAKELTPHKSHLFNTKIKEVYIRQQK